MPCCRQASSSVAPFGDAHGRPVDRDVDQPPGRLQEHRAHDRLPPVPADQAEPHRRLGGADGRLAQAADRGVAGDHGDVIQQREFPLGRSDRSAAQQPSEQFLLAHRPEPARHALPAGLVPEEPGDPPEQIGHVHGVIEHQDDAGSQRRADRAHTLERERGIQRVRSHERARRTAEQHRPQRPPAAHPARRIDHLPQRDPELVLVQAGPLNAARQAEQPGTGGTLGADPREGGPADPQDLQHAQQRLHVVDGGRLAEQPGLRRERRLVTRLGPLALDRVDQRGFLTRDVGAGAPPDLDVEGETLAHHVRAEEAAGPGVRDGVPQPRLGQRVLAPDVDVTLLRPAGVAHDRERFEQGVRVLLHQYPVLERAGLGFVGVADHVVRPDRVGGHRLPLHRDRERRSAAAEQLGVLQLPDHALRPGGHRPAEHLVPARRAVGIERARVDAAPPAAAAGARSGPPLPAGRAGEGARRAPRARAPTAPERDRRGPARPGPGPRPHAGSWPPSRGRTGPGKGCAARRRRCRWTRPRFPRRRSGAPSPRIPAPRRSPGRRGRRRRARPRPGRGWSGTGRRTTPPRTPRPGGS